MFSTIKNFFTKARKSTPTPFEQPKVYQKTENAPTNGFLQSEVVNDEPKIKKLKRSRQTHTL